ncbi:MULTISPECIES: hypothetical protein [Bacillus cereus group]|uniref:hypothetical protein n=1 Tax=Bacillus cereus group TaxID=86661 RepID=UPI0012A94B17|nr:MULTISPECIES: hypothetical protein [Bacillus cereus group]MCC2510909.1 hypothetical protein [Bacillus cereus]MDA2195864.1 hypothetical protein [Bacillus cereus group sp. Bc238]MDA2201460.1 hypothetical protein [Bacillus cereus group sp. Bc237]QGG16713.1 hypothetical protein GH772_03120 [Bacillus paranthracis]
MFSTREYSIILWLSIIIIFALFKNGKEIGLSFLSVIKAFFNLLKNVASILMVVYLFLVIYLLSYLKIMEFEMIKDYVIWIFSAFFPAMYKVVIHRDISVLKMFKDLFKFSVFFMFIISEYTFNFWLELIIIVPISFILVLVSSFIDIENKTEYKQLKNIINVLLALLGFIVLYYAMISFIDSFKDVEKMIFWKKLFFEIVIFCLHIPILYFSQIFSITEQIVLKTNLIWDSRRKNKAIIFLLLKSRFKKEKLNDFYEMILANKRVNNMRELKDLINN